LVIAVVVNLLMPKSQQHMNMINMNAKELNLEGVRLRVEHFEAGEEMLKGVLMSNVCTIS